MYTIPDGLRKDKKVRCATEQRNYKEEKDSDRDEAKRYFRILSNYFKQKKEEVDKKVKEEKGWNDTNLYVKGKLEGRWETYKELEEYFSNH